MKKVMLVVNIVIISTIILFLFLANKEQSVVAVSRARCPESKCDLLTNEGNVDLVIHRSGVTGMLPLAVNHSMAVGEKENVTAGQNPFKD